MHLVAVRVTAALAIAVGMAPSALPARAQDGAQIARGRYLVKLGGCNDCHTDGFAQSDARTPEKDWLEGSSLGFYGPWGTTYAINLRLLVGGMTEAQWLDSVGTTQSKPPMPWWALHWMTPQDQRAVYVYIRHLGPAGKETPKDLPPGTSPPPPVLSWPMPPAKAPG
jgi:mono/diheme cytochrome c family protein